MTVALVHPWLYEAATKNRLKFRESLALGYLTGALEAAGYRVVTVNAELECLSPERVAERLAEIPDLGLLGISAKSQRTYAAAKAIAALVKAKQPDVHVTVGGVFPSAAAGEVLVDAPHIDSVVRGEGEHPITELAWRLENGAALAEMIGITLRNEGEVITTGLRPRVRDLDALPMPARRDLDWIIENGATGGHSAYLVASRGCYAACTFCSIHQIYGNHHVVRRSPESIVAEMKMLGERHGVHRFSFVDDLFIMPSPRGFRWVDEFCEAIEGEGLDVKFYAEMRADTIRPEFVRKLMRAGLHRLFIGVESGVDSVLLRWDKGTTLADNESALANLRQIGMPAHAINFGYIMFDPEMTLSELREQYEWIRRSGYCKVQHLQNRMNIYWGTPQHAKMVAQGRAEDTPLGDRWDYEFDDPAVAEVHKTVRWFHARYDDEESEPLVRARESFLAMVQEDRSVIAVPDLLFDALSQASRRLDEQERDLYYRVFDASFAQVEHELPCDDAFREELWASLLPALRSAQAEATLMESFSSALGDLAVVEPDVPFGPGSARLHPDGDTIEVWVHDRPGDNGYRSTPVQTPADRYEHNCHVMSFS